MQLEKTFVVTNGVFFCVISYTPSNQKKCDNEIIHDLIVFIYLESLLCEIKMMIQFSHLGKLVEHHSSLYNCSDFSS